MRLYSVAVVSLTIRAPLKWTDNLLSQHSIVDVSHRQRGSSRGVPWSALVRIGLIRTLNEELGCGVRDAVALAEILLDATAGHATLTGFLALDFDRGAFEADLQDRLREAIESAPRPRRGRPSLRGGRHTRDQIV
jgi:hypothetical protein